MAELYRLESDDPQAGGVLVKFPSGVQKTACWRSASPISPTIDAAKQYAAAIVDAMCTAGHIDDIERTNIASLVAAIHKVISDWNDALRARMPAGSDSLH